MASPGVEMASPGEALGSSRKRAYGEDEEAEEASGGAGGYGATNGQAGPLMPKRLNLMASFGGRQRDFQFGRSAVGHGGAGGGGGAGAGCGDGDGVGDGGGDGGAAGGAGVSAGGGGGSFGGLPSFPRAVGADFNVGFSRGRASVDEAEDGSGEGVGGDDGGDAEMGGENVKRHANSVFGASSGGRGGFGGSGIKKSRPSSFGRGGAGGAGSSSSAGSSAKFSERDVKYRETRHAAEMNKVKARHQYAMLQVQSEMEELAGRAEAAEAAAREAQGALAAGSAELSKLRQENGILKRAVNVQNRQMRELQDRAAQQEGQIAMLQEALRLAELHMGTTRVFNGVAGSRGYGGFEGFDPPPPDVF
uniref:Uncharacterized protein n=1 Tax=Bicosoecida sp. CB-2014 TaxID=1486930 RepID=A0A7S1G310_9STRA|mmetsp:Transcript_12654/g.44313  ORF Transcript_12654/g.44313 Transcript_12654/m.44313 type:complete len:362 (+) Transcript_12654:457-1542(+)